MSEMDEQEAAAEFIRIMNMLATGLGRRLQALPKLVAAE
jgi:hypothetical protein